jgi:RNA polymerase sigma-70 factor (ECF subfamily)
MITEDLLIHQSKDGNENAFSQLLNQVLPKIQALIVKNYNLQQADIDDIIQQASEKAWIKLLSFRGESAFVTWFYSIIRNEALNYIKKTKSINKREVHTSQFRTGEFEDINDDCDLLKTLDEKLEANACSILEKKEELESYRIMLNHVMDDLSKAHRDIIQLVHEEELTYKDVSQKLDIPMGTVMSRLFFARKQAQTLIKQYARQHELQLSCLG